MTFQVILHFPWLSLTKFPDLFQFSQTHRSQGCSRTTTSRQRPRPGMVQATRPSNKFSAHNSKTCYCNWQSNLKLQITMQSNGLWPEPTLKTRVFEVKAKARGVPGQGQDFSWPRPEIFVLEVSSRLRTVLKDPTPSRNPVPIPGLLWECSMLATGYHDGQLKTTGKNCDWFKLLYFTSANYVPKHG